MKKLLTLLLSLFVTLSGAPWDPVLDYWFVEIEPQKQWNGGPAIDAEIEQRFGHLVEAASKGELRSWNSAGRGQLALVILLDQFSRNIYRGTPRAFANDARARAIAADMVIKGIDLRLTPNERAFIYMPFQHAESLAFQDQSVALFAKLAAEEPSLAGHLRYAQGHRSQIVRFGRFPHRNAILARASTPEEEAYLAG